MGWVGWIHPAYLVQKPVWCVGYDAEDTLLADPGLGGGDGGLTEEAKAALLDDGEQLSPILRIGAAEGGTVQPAGLGMAKFDADRLAAYVEVGHLAFVVKAGREAPAGGRVLLAFVEAERGRDLEVEVRIGGGEEEEGCGCEGLEGRHVEDLLRSGSVSCCRIVIFSRCDGSSGQLLRTRATENGGCDGCAGNAPNLYFGRTTKC